MAVHFAPSASGGLHWRPLDVAATPSSHIIDVRPTEERYSSTGFIAGSRGCAMTEDGQRVLDLCAQFDPDAIVVLACSSGRRSAHAATVLAARSAARLVVMVGGTRGWKEAGLPLCGTHTPPLERLPPIATLNQLPSALALLFPGGHEDYSAPQMTQSALEALIRSVLREHCGETLELSRCQSAVEHLGEIARRAGHPLTFVQEFVDLCSATLARLALTQPRALAR